MKKFRSFLYWTIIFLVILIVVNLCISCKKEGLTTNQKKPPNGNAMCSSQYPIIKNGVLYATVARNDPKKQDCGKCWEVEFSNLPANSPVKQVFLQQTNLGSDVGGWGDLLVPGGGFGKYNGCEFMKGWAVYTHQGGPCSPTSDTADCARYGGFKNKKFCNTAFPGDPLAQTACNEVLWGGKVFPPPDSAGFPQNLKVKRYREVNPPKEFERMSGQRHQRLGLPGPWINGNDALLTHYWDCCKSACSWSDAPKPMPVCGATGVGPMKPYDDNVKSICDLLQPPPDIHDGCDCAWTNNKQNCGKDDNSHCWKVCCGSSPGPTPGPPPGPGPPSGCDCTWTNNKQNCGKDDNSHCWKVCCGSSPGPTPGPPHHHPPGPPPPSGGSAALYGQCGGKGWTGPTSCVKGSICHVQSPYYSQCLPN